MCLAKICPQHPEHAEIVLHKRNEYKTYVHIAIRRHKKDKVKCLLGKDAGSNKDKMSFLHFNRAWHTKRQKLLMLKSVSKQPDTSKNLILWHLHIGSLRIWMQHKVDNTYPVNRSATRNGFSKSCTCKAFSIEHNLVLWRLKPFDIVVRVLKIWNVVIFCTQCGAAPTHSLNNRWQEALGSDPKNVYTDDEQPRTIIGDVQLLEDGVNET